MAPFALPRDTSRLRVVNSFDELVSTRFDRGVNALCWQRTLEGDFREVVESLSVREGILPLDEERLRSLRVSPAGQRAIEAMLEDRRRLEERGLEPVLECIAEYPRDEGEVVPTDVYSFHVDSATEETDTYLCTYYGPSSEGLRNEEARRRVEIPETRAELLKRFGGGDGDRFLEFLNENSYDRHYAPLPGAVPFSFGLGNLWRVAVDWPGCPVPPCVHRAPATLPGDPPRLLLIS